jgi:hypothetical protein
MGIRKWIVAAAIPIASLALPIATAGAAAANPLPTPPPTTPIISGEVTGLHTFVMPPGEVVVYGEELLPLTFGYESSVPVIGIYTNPITGFTAVTTGYTFLPLNKIGKVISFYVVST